MGIQIAIDGPSGAGKSTISRALAKELGYVYIDTGAMYRTIGLQAYRSEVDPKNETEVAKLLPNIELDIRHIDGVQHIFLNGEDVSAPIREHLMSRYASDVSALPAVRAFLLDYQRRFAQQYNVIMDGRDIGTVILPQAQVKIFLTASSEVRAKRRHKELLGKGENVLFETVLADVIQRDENDSSRKAAPLKAADDAIIVDTSSNTFDQSVAQLKEIIGERLKCFIK